MQRRAVHHPKLALIRMRKKRQNLAEQRAQPRRRALRTLSAHHARHRRRRQHLVRDVERDKRGAARQRPPPQHRARGLRIDVDVELGGGAGVAGGGGGRHARGQRAGRQRRGGPAQQAVVLQQRGGGGGREARWEARGQRAVQRGHEGQREPAERRVREERADGAAHDRHPADVCAQVRVGGEEQRGVGQRAG